MPTMDNKCMKTAVHPSFKKSLLEKPVDVGPALAESKAKGRRFALKEE